MIVMSSVVCQGFVLVPMKLISLIYESFNLEIKFRLFIKKLFKNTLNIVIIEKLC